jgi:hypothetical protein
MHRFRLFHGLRSRHGPRLHNRPVSPPERPDGPVIGSAGHSVLVLFPLQPQATHLEDQFATLGGNVAYVACLDGVIDSLFEFPSRQRDFLVRFPCVMCLQHGIDCRQNLCCPVRHQRRHRSILSRNKKSPVSTHQMTRAGPG